MNQKVIVVIDRGHGNKQHLVGNIVATGSHFVKVRFEDGKDSEFAEWVAIKSLKSNCVFEL